MKAREAIRNFKATRFIMLVRVKGAESNIECMKTGQTWRDIRTSRTIKAKTGTKAGLVIETTNTSRPADATV